MVYTWDQAANVVNCKKRYPRQRWSRLIKFPEHVEECVTKFMGWCRNGTDPDAGEVVCNTIIRAMVPIGTVLEVVQMFKHQCPDLVKRVLLVYAREAVDDLSQLPEFIREYFETDLPLDTLKACIISDLVSKCYIDHTTFYHDTLNIFVDRYSRDLVFQNEEKGTELLIHVSKFLLEYFIDSSYERDGMHSPGFLFCMDTDDRRMLRSYFPYIQSMCDEKRTRAIQHIIDELGCYRKIDYVDEYIELYDMIHGSPLPEIVDSDLPELPEFADEEQNVHRVKLEREVLVELYKLAEKYKDREESMEDLYDDIDLCKILKKIDSDTSNFYGKTLKEWLKITYIWAEEEEYMDNLEQELKDMKEMCPTDQFQRLVCVMDGHLFDLEEIGHKRNIVDEFFDAANELIQAQPDADEIMANLSTRGIEYVNEVTKEMLEGEEDEEERVSWEEIMDTRRLYLYGRK